MQAKILIVDDEQYIRELYAHILTAAGHIVEESANGQDAFTKISGGDYNLILLDIMIPALDGIQLLERLQKEGHGAKIKQIILLTNLDEERTVAQGVSFGIRGYLVKSQNPPEKLTRKIAELLAE
ncbi:response regulator [Candidatus Microgenomates bacterium]|nr:response regulator [Candidatus Microgenomates bacterium]